MDSKVNGIKTAVKHGELTTQQALDKLKEWNQFHPWLTPTRTINWLKNHLK